MANQQRQGTGRHGHKDTQEPWPHTQGAEGGEHPQSHGGERQQSQNRSGGGRQQQQGGSGARQQQQQREGGSSDRAEQQSLKEREYKGEDGQIHHHTNTYMEQHGKEGGRQDR